MYAPVMVFVCSVYKYLLIPPPNPTHPPHHAIEGRTVGRGERGRNDRGRYDPGQGGPKTKKEESAARTRRNTKQNINRALHNAYAISRYR